MLFDVKIQNLGKLSDALIRIGGFTVFAGPNGTGKSFVSKALYSIFDAMNANHAERYIGSLLNPVESSFTRLMRQVEDGDVTPATVMPATLKNAADAFQSGVTELKKAVDKMSTDGSVDEFDAIERTFPKIKEIIFEINTAHEKVESEFRAHLVNAHDHEYDAIADAEIAKFREQVKKLLGVTENLPKDIIMRGIANEVMRNLNGNFQIANASDLKSDKEQKIIFNINSVGEIKINDTLQFRIQSAGLQQLQKYSRVIYLESPVHWKLASALERARRAPRFFYLPQDRMRLIGAPKYFYDLADTILEEYTGDLAFPDLFEELTANISGKIALKESGELCFEEKDGGSFPLSLVSTGIVNLGILALLIERKILDDGSFLFIDEPEANLHPAWQIKMVETLFKLSQEGVKVVIATHSADILQRIAAFVAEDPDAEKSIELNHFRKDGKVRTSNGEFADRLSEIQEELTEPYADSYYGALK